MKSEGCRAEALAEADEMGSRIRSCELRLGKPARKMPSFTYVCVLQSDRDPRRFYAGCTDDLRERLVRHSDGRVQHTAKWKPWSIKTYIALSDPRRATDFERYLKSASGRAFVKKRL
jgi:predicted GIY-YIG superfamily endonuclease